MASYILPDPVTARHRQMLEDMGMAAETRSIPQKSSGVKNSKPAPKLGAEEREMIESLGVSETTYLAEREKARHTADEPSDEEVAAAAGVAVESVRKAREEESNG